MYSAVYKCVCKQYSDRLYSDVMDHIARIVTTWADNLARAHGGLEPDSELPFVKEFHVVLSRYFHALSSIVPIFTYMVRTYLNAHQSYFGLFTHSKFYNSS
jgi:hypothetical protein